MNKAPPAAVMILIGGLRWLSEAACVFGWEHATMAMAVGSSVARTVCSTDNQQPSYVKEKPRRKLPITLPNPKPSDDGTASRTWSWYCHESHAPCAEERCQVTKACQPVTNQKNAVVFTSETATPTMQYASLPFYSLYSMQKRLLPAAIACPTKSLE